jgi:cation:H+ antiporter
VILSELPFWTNIAIFTASAAVVWFAGTHLARYADEIAEHTGIGREVLGILMLGGITSLPELAVALTATWQGTPLLSISDVLGSAAINLVILAIADACIGRSALTGVQGSSSVLLQGVLGILLMAIVAGSYITGDVLLVGMGVCSWLMLLVYLGSVALLANARTSRAWVTAGDHGSPVESDTAAQRSLRSVIRRSIYAGAAILVAGFLLARSGDSLAHQTGLGTSFFGMIFLGFSTSLPEVSTVLAAVRIRRYSMAISDVFGTNLFNVTIVALVDLMHPGGPVLAEAGAVTSFGALLALAITAIYVAGLLERRDRTVLRMGYDSAAVILVYIAGVAILYNLS